LIDEVFVLVVVLATATAWNRVTAMSTSSEEKGPVIVFLLGVTATLIALELSLNDHRESWLGKDNVTFGIRVFLRFYGVERKAPK
jgi:hypothetical protein